MFYFLLLAALVSCDRPGIKVTSVETRATPGDETSAGGDGQTPGKLAADECIDPDLSALREGIELTLCDGTIGTGTLRLSSACAKDGDKGCVVGGTLEAIDVSQLSPGDIRSGAVIAGVAGNFAGSLAACSKDGEVGCIAVASHPAVDITGLAGKVLDGEIVAGITGTYAPDFPEVSNVRSSDSVDGVPGTLSDCASDGAVGCVANSDFKAVAVNGLAANIKNGVIVAGETGTYPSSGNLLSGADGTADLSSTTFQAKIKSSVPFEYFDAAGNRYTDVGDDDIDAANITSGVNIFGVEGSADVLEPDPWDLRYGVSVGSTTGKLKVNCRNMIGSFDYSASPASAGADVWDTVDDHNNGGSFPFDSPWTDQYFCGYNEPSDSTWQRVTTTPATSGESSVYEDKITGLRWTRSGTTTGWDYDSDQLGKAGAINGCEASDSGGITDWRLPTQKELIAAYSHGIYDLDSAFTASNNLGSLNEMYWSSSTVSANTDYAWAVNLATGAVLPQLKSQQNYVLCVSDDSLSAP